ncbi:hypothetical protein L3V82_11850 [Thiotrichales bacterium 19S3-7]|nr:hypothetical protein [Thiotrichales bacterium 19S3-7]MCF6802907.1 hypothetical protein [Thiotrichales bacterium 19S3-11]
MTTAQKKFLICFAIIMAMLNTYALYSNILYYIANPHDAVETGMLFFNVIEQTYCIYIFFLFRAIRVNLFDKLVIYSIGAVSIILNLYYLLLDYQWTYIFSSVVFWMIYNTSMILFSLTLFHYIYKTKVLN